MNNYLFRLRRVSTLIIFSCLSLFMVTETSAQLIGGGGPKKKPKPVTYDPPEVSDFEECAEVPTTSTLPVYLYNGNDEEVGISNITLDIDPSISYTSPGGTIPPNSTKTFYVTFDNSLTLEDIFGLGEELIDINLNMTLGTFSDLTILSVDVEGFYCITPLVTIDDGHTSGGNGNGTTGAIDKFKYRLASGAGDISVNPNPARSDINVSFVIEEDDTDFSAVIYNSLGQEVKSLVKNSSYMKGDYSENHDISELDNGIYFLVVRVGEKTKTISISKL